MQVEVNQPPFMLLNAPLSRFGHHVYIPDETALQALHVPAVVIFIQEYIAAAPGALF